METLMHLSTIKDLFSLLIKKQFFRSNTLGGSISQFRSLLRSTQNRGPRNRGGLSINRSLNRGGRSIPLLLFKPFIKSMRAELFDSK